MKVLVCGSRNWNVSSVIRRQLAQLPPGTLVIHGTAGGADRIAAQSCDSLKIKHRAYPADWKLHGQRAGILRNLEMLDEQPQLVLAFWDGVSRGTSHVISQARKRGIRVHVVSP